MTIHLITLICLAGIAACLIYRPQAPLPLTIAAAALAGILAINMLEWVAEPIFYRALGPQRQGGLLVSNALGALRLIKDVVRSAALGGLVWAVLAGRGIDFRAPIPHR